MNALTLTVAEVASALGQSERSVYRAVARGEIPNVGIGQRVQIPRRWLEERFAQVGVSITGETHA